MKRQIEKFFYSKSLRLTDYPVFRCYYHDMWFDGSGYSSNQRYSVSIYYAISPKASNANIIRTLRADCVLPKKQHFHISDISTDENIYIENDNMSQMYELELMHND